MGLERMPNHLSELENLEFQVHSWQIHAFFPLLLEKIFNFFILIAKKFLILVHLNKFFATVLLVPMVVINSISLHSLIYCSTNCPF